MVLLHFITHDLGFGNAITGVHVLGTLTMTLIYPNKAAASETKNNRGNAMRYYILHTATVEKRS